MSGGFVVHLKLLECPIEGP